MAKSEQARYRQAQRVTYLGAAVNALLAFLKIVFGWFGLSHALMADGLHSLADLATDFLVLLASRWGSQAADLDHPYGHRRIETAATVLLSLLIVLTGVGILYDTTSHLFTEHSTTPSAFVLGVALLSVLANETLYRYTLLVGRRIDSKLIEANAWHHRSDAASSVMVLLGVGGALLGFPYLDMLAALLVAVMIIHMGWQLGWQSILELIDTGVDEATLTQIKQVIAAVPGVQAVHQLRNRAMGGHIFIDVHILVKPRLTVSEGHYVSQQVHHRLMHRVEKVVDVTVHVDPEDDELYPPSLDLPGRDTLLPALEACWQKVPYADQIENINLHYLAGHIEVDVLLATKAGLELPMLEQLAQDLYKAVESMAYIREVRVLLQQTEGHI